MLISPVTESNLLSFMENTEVSLETGIPIIVESNLSEEEKRLELDNKIGTLTPDGAYRFAGYKDLVKVIC